MYIYIYIYTLPENNGSVKVVEAIESCCSAQVAQRANGGAREAGTRRGAARLIHSILIILIQLIGLTQLIQLIRLILISPSWS